MEGALMVLENSHRSERLLSGISSPTPIEMACNGSTTTQCQYKTTMATGG